MDTSWSEVEQMAQAASAADALQSESFPTDAQISRWQVLFHYSRREALNLIKAQRSDLTRSRITDEHWELVREEKERLGHDRETYEHSLQLGDVMKSQGTTITGTDGVMRFVFRLGGVLGTKEKVREVAGLEADPKIVEGQSEMGVAQFCIVDETAKEKIERWLLTAQLGEADEKR